MGEASTRYRRNSSHPTEFAILHFEYMFLCYVTLSEVSIMQSLYDQLGGRPRHFRCCRGFYRKMLSDDRVSRFFDGVDMDRQMAKQTAFITMVTGGPNNYTGRDMRTGRSPRQPRSCGSSR